MESILRVCPCALNNSDGASICYLLRCDPNKVPVALPKMATEALWVVEGGGKSLPPARAVGLNAPGRPEMAHEAARVLGRADCWCL